MISKEGSNFSVGGITKVSLLSELSPSKAFCHLADIDVTTSCVNKKCLSDDKTVK